MAYYEDNRKRSRLLKFSAGVGSAVMLIAGRQRLASYFLGAAEAAINKSVGSNIDLIDTAFSKSVSTIKRTIEQGIRSTLIHQVGSDRMINELVQNRGWTQEAAEELFRSERRAALWTSGKINRIGRVLNREEYSGLRGMLSNKNTAEIALDLDAAREVANVRSLNFQRIDKKTGKESLFVGDRDAGALAAKYNEARTKAEKEFIDHLVNSIPNDRSLSERMLGVRSAEIGEIVGQGYLPLKGEFHLIESVNYVKKLAEKYNVSPDLIDKIRLNDIKVDKFGYVTNLGGGKDVINRLLDQLQYSTQIPIIPYLPGMSPASLFSWLRTSTNDAAYIVYKNNVKSQIAARDLVKGNKNASLMLLGNSVMSLDFSAGAASAAEVVGRGYAGLSSRGGFSRKIVERLIAADNATEKPGILGWLGKQEDPSKFAFFKSIFKKYTDEDSKYPSEVLRRLLLEPDTARNQKLHDIATSSPEYILSLASFLKGEGEVSANVAQYLFKDVLETTKSESKDIIELKELVNALSDNKNLEAAFRKISLDISPIRWRSDALNSAMSEFANTSGEYTKRAIPALDRSGLPILGRRDNRAGIDKMREAVVDEMLERFSTQEDFIAKLDKAEGLDKDVAEKAAAYIQGTVLKSSVEELGHQAAIQRFTHTQRLVDNAEYMVNKRLSVLNTNIPIEEDFDLPSTFILGQSQSFLSLINKRVMNGESPIQALLGAVSGIATGKEKEYVSQYTTAWLKGAEAGKAFTETSMVGYFMEERLSEALGSLGLGLSNADQKSAFSILTGLTLKRAMPVWVGYELYNYLNYENDLFGIPAPDRFFANISSRASLIRAKHTDEHDKYLYPGLEKYFNITTLEEEKDRQLHGYDAVRSGRFWLFGSRSEFMGGKIRYFLPTKSQLAYSNWESASNVDLSSGKYWAHSIIPTPLYPLSPIFHFTDPYWWEKEHSTGEHPDRPYVKSGQLFSYGTPWSGLGNATIGRLLKPVKTLYPEYDPKYRQAKSALDIIKTSRPSEIGWIDYLNNVDALGRGADELISNREEMLADLAYEANAAEDNEASFTVNNGTVGKIRTAGGIAPKTFYQNGPSFLQELNLRISRVLGLGRMPQVSTDDLAITSANSGYTWSGQYVGGSSPKEASYSDGAVVALNSLGRRSVSPYFIPANEIISKENLDTALSNGNPLVDARIMDQNVPNIIGYSENPNDVSYQSNIVNIAYSAKEHLGIYGWFGEVATHMQPQPLQMAYASSAYDVSSRFWEMGLGGLGGDISEIGRRFLYKRSAISEYYDPVPNAFYGTWIPGDNYFINFQRGDPYNKIPYGEVRLPGEAYERVHGLKLMQAKASYLGMDTAEIAAHLTHTVPEESFDPAWKKAIVQYWGKQGLVAGRDIPVYDPKLGVVGSIDALLNINKQNLVAKIVPISDTEYRSGETGGREEAEMNFLLKQAKTPYGLLVYVNKDYPSDVKIKHVEYDELQEKLAEHRLDKARKSVQSLVKSGTINRNMLYDNVTRFEILADVAPYSNEYRALGNVLAKDKTLTQEEHDRYIAAKTRAREQKKTVNLYPYHFAEGNKLTTKLDVVAKIIDANTLKLGSGKTIKLAGVRASTTRFESIDKSALNEFNSKLRDSLLKTEKNLETFYDYIRGVDNSTAAKKAARDDPLYQIAPDLSKASMMWSRYGVGPGTVIKYSYSTEKSEQYSTDMFGSTKAVVSTLLSENINRKMLLDKVAVEKESDWSAPAVLARFGPTERAKGKAWERFAHLDTPFNSKFLRVRSPYEEYVRGHVYGTNQGSWEHPVRSYITPTIFAYIARNPIAAAASMGLFTSMFVQTKGLKGKAAIAGAIVGGALSSIRSINEIINNKPWIPKPVQKRRDLNEYWDMLKYVKYKRLYAYAKERARLEEFVNVDKLVMEERKEGISRKKLAKTFADAKAKLRGAIIPNIKVQEEITAINTKLQEVQDYTKYSELGPWTSQALLYRQKYQATLYNLGTSDDQNVADIIAALPKEDREIFSAMVTGSTDAEKKKFYRLLPTYEKRVMGRLLGIDDKKLPKQKTAEEYFRTHTLPKANWEGWDPNVNLDLLKARATAYEKLDPMEFGLYPQSINKAEALTSNIKVPDINGTTANAAQLLSSLMRGYGVRGGANVLIAPDPYAGSSSIAMNVYTEEDGRDDLISALQNS